MFYGVLLTSKREIILTDLKGEIAILQKQLGISIPQPSTVVRIVKLVNKQLHSETDTSHRKAIGNTLSSHGPTQWCVGTHNKTLYIRKEQVMQSVLSEHMRMKLGLNQENLKARECL